FRFWTMGKTLVVAADQWAAWLIGEGNAESATIAEKKFFQSTRQAWAIEKKKREQQELKTKHRTD
ncbi:hypothetical protein TYRP_009668, partial [Tyrophagus putrescentiae]